MSRSKSLPLPVPQLRLALSEPNGLATVALPTTAEIEELVRLLAELMLEVAGLTREAGHDDER